MNATLAESADVTYRTVVVEVCDDEETRPIYEVIEGAEVDKPMSMLSQLVGSTICVRVGMHLLSSGEGGYVITEPWVLCFDWAPGDKRRPDVAYWRRDQYPDGVPDRGEATVPPAWVVEVVSPSETTEALFGKIADYFRAGTALVWVVDPINRTIRTERPDGTAHTYRAGDSANAAPVLPEFSATISDFFPD